MVYNTYYELVEDGIVIDVKDFDRVPNVYMFDKIIYLYKKYIVRECSII